jgi:hypothetical protein
MERRGGVGRGMGGKESGPDTQYCTLAPLLATHTKRGQIYFPAADFISKIMVGIFFFLCRMEGVTRVPVSNIVLIYLVANGTLFDLFLFHTWVHRCRRYVYIEHTLVCLGFALWIVLKMIGSLSVE